MHKAIPVAVVLAIAGAVTVVIIAQHRAAKEPAPPAAPAAWQPTPAQTAAEPLPAPPPQEPAPTVVQEPRPPTPEPAPQTATPPPAARTDNKPAKAPGQAGQGGRAPKPPLQDPLAREALALVGVNPTAEAYWYAAINDPSLSGHERSDLIEDLNEDGLSDPKHPGPEDLPVILNRIQVIEAAGSYVMDQVNADAFQEAYKDLLNLADLVLGAGQPVK